MMGRWVKPLASRVRRMTCTRPSIMSDGATMSAPARAWASAWWARFSTVGSLATSPSRITPQWPWDVYSQKQTSVITARSGAWAFTAAIARGMMPSAAHPAEPVSSFFSGMPNRITAGMPRSRTVRHSSASTSTDIWNTPGMEVISFFTPRPGTANSG